MATIRAVVVDPNASGRLTLKEVDAPSPLPSEALVRVAAVSLNRGEVRRSTNAEAGWRPGWDVVGTIEQAAADGSGPQAGARVVGLVNSGAWGELVAVSTNMLAELPPEVTFAQAATLPVAGLTALYALGHGGSLLDRKVLITGASGGVGHFACQLARLSGAKVVGAFRNPEHEAFVRNAGAQEVVIGEDLSPAKAYGPYSLILDSVGGSSLGTALSLLAPDSTCVFFGTTGGKEVTFDAAQFYQAGGKTLYGFFLFHELQREPASIGLKRLANLIAQGHLRPQIDVEAPWTQVGDIAQQLLDRRFRGKAVLHISN
jgi:NADPH:quinone reductase-like Zn-dependent oxidoreductase